MKKVWWKEAVAYQIYPRSFMDSNGDGIGDLKGITSKLDYLQDLGIDLIWICPFYKTPNDDNGYDISDYEDIAEEFGNMEDTDELILEVHKRGMKIIMDLVINHSSDEHPWFMESRSSKDNPKRDWYMWRDGKGGQEPNNWESIFTGSAWEYDEATEQYYLHVFSRKQPDLNWENPEMRKEVYGMVNRWLDKGIDGFRIDAISHIKKDPTFTDMPNPKGEKYVASFPKHMNVDGIQPFLEELKNKTFSKYDIVTVGEANGVSVEEADTWIGEENGKMNMLFQFEQGGLWDAGTRKGLDVKGLKKVLTKWQKGLENVGWNALYLENHDKARIVSTWGNDTMYWYESATSLGAMYFLMQGTPFIYQGQEIGMTNFPFQRLEEFDDVGTKNLYKKMTESGVCHEEIMELISCSSRDNSRTPMQWSGDMNAGFTTGSPWLQINPNYKDINVAKQLEDKHSILHFYKKLIALKKENDIFTYGIYELLAKRHPYIYAYSRTLGEEQVIVMCNLSEKATVYNHLTETLHGKKLMLHNYPVQEHKYRVRIKLKPYEMRVYQI